MLSDEAHGLLMTGRANGDPRLVHPWTGERVQIRSLVNLVAEFTEFEMEVCWNTSKLGGQPCRILDTNRAQDAIAFGVAAELGLQRTMRRYWECCHG